MSRTAHRFTFSPAFADPESPDHVVVRVACSCGDSSVGSGPTVEDARAVADSRIRSACLGESMTPGAILGRALAGRR